MYILSYHVLALHDVHVHVCVCLMFNVPVFHFLTHMYMYDEVRTYIHVHVPYVDHLFSQIKGDVHLDIKLVLIEAESER